MKNEAYYANKIVYSIFVFIGGLVAHAAEQIQQIFVSVSANDVIRNVTTAATDPGQQMITQLGLSFYNILQNLPSLTINLFIGSACILIIVLIWAPEINKGLERLQTLKITFSENKEKKE